MTANRDASSTGYILTFHSQNVPGYPHSDIDDHVALDRALELVAELRMPVLRLVEVARQLRRGGLGLPPKYVCLTFDDGTDYDWEPVRGPTGQVHEPFVAILQRHSKRWAGVVWKRKVVATSFVVASPEARLDIMRPLLPVCMSEGWWKPAQRSGFIDIGVHGWDHVHPSVVAMQSQPQLVERFDRVASLEQAQVQVERAGSYIAERAGTESAQLFAYPYGQVSEFLAASYLPGQDRIIAAFTTEGTPIKPGMDIWRLPRMVCGWHWRSVPELRALLVN